MTDDDDTRGVVAGWAESARLVEQAFQTSFDAIERQMGRAAKSGELSFRAMVDAIVADLSRVAFQSLVTKPLEGLLSGLFDFGGARAAGGPVAPGRAYLVGEQGPELFTPSGHGAIAPQGAGAARPAVVVNVTAHDAASFLRSEGQVAAMLSRAVLRGQRGL
ncbi:MAG: phage tail tape measure protein [Alphaproteobacteria bacterium]|nr:phage tail tape measure protein [Alphaproteobacteria bacterium]